MHLTTVIVPKRRLGMPETMRSVVLFTRRIRLSCDEVIGVDSVANKMTLKDFLNQSLYLIPSPIHGHLIRFFKSFHRFHLWLFTFNPFGVTHLTPKGLKIATDEIGGT